MRNALIGIAVVALALSTTFGAVTMFVSTEGPTIDADSGEYIMGATPVNAQVTTKLLIGESMKLYVWMTPDFTITHKLNASGVPMWMAGKPVWTSSFLSSTAIDLKAAGAGKVTGSAATVFNPYADMSGNQRFQLTVDGNVNTAGSLWAGGFGAAVDGGAGVCLSKYPRLNGAFDLLQNPGNDVTRTIMGPTSATNPTLKAWAVPDTDDNSIVWGEITITGEALGHVLITGAVGDKTFANNLGTEEMIKFGAGAAVSGKTPGLTNGNILADIEVIPEPATMALLAVGGIAGLLRRRNA